MITDVPILAWLLSALSYALTLLLLPVVLLTKNRQSMSSVAWMLAIIFLPIAGAILFLLFGINRVERRRRSRQKSSSQLAEHCCEPTEFDWIPGPEVRPEVIRLSRLVERMTESVPTTGNDVELLTDTNRTLALIEKAIREAKQHIHLEYYIWQPDRSGTRLRDLLIQKAREGVKIRFLYDRFGSLWLSDRFVRPMRAAGIEVAPFLPGQTIRERWSVNLRNHRKIVVVDGQVAFTGGMNIGDEYLGRNKAIGFWRDAHLRITGPEVWRLQAIFAEDWLYATGELLVGSGTFPPVSPSGSVIAQTVASGPDEEVTGIVQATILSAIYGATDRILLVTSYFAPPSAIVSALENAAYRGVKVRLILSGRANHVVPLYAGRSEYDSLLKAGVEIHEYQKGLLHSKTLSVDGIWSLVGSANMDCRSFFLNFEAGVILYDKALAEHLERQFEVDVKDSLWIKQDVWKRRPKLHVIAERFCRLWKPVL